MIKDSNDLTTKDTIIEATKRVLREKGNVTIKEIAEAAFVNIAAINYHFGSKDNLINIVISEMLKDLREEISKIIYQSGYNKENFGGLMATLVDVVFTFAEQNTGIVSYSFVQIVSEPTSTNVLVEFFLKDQEFVQLIISSLKIIFPDVSYETLYAKYLVLFSSFVVPFFLNFSFITKEENKQTKVEMSKAFNQFKDAYVEELKAILTPKPNA